MNSKVKSIVEDKNGRIVIWQTPNTLLWIWITLRVITQLLNEGQVKTGFEQLSTAVLFTWATYELSKGANLFRKLLGFVILAYIIYGFFNK